ncbi:MAG TPA: MOSC N-terminal beta barrel domain-containing protein [Marinagarivorans sp.]
MMHKVGTIQSIWRYPVKGMAGESLPECRISAEGLEGDRIWAVQDCVRQEIQSCKFRPDLLRCQATCCTSNAGALSGDVDITLPDNKTVASNNPAVHSLISELLKRDSQLCRRQPFDQSESFYRRHKQDDHTWLEELKATFTREPGEPLPDLENLPQTMQDYVTIPGTFFLVSHCHILTTASLSHMQALQPNADWAVERFRPNLMIKSEPGCEGLIEQDWIGKKLQIGELEIACESPAPRCGAVTRAQKHLPSDTSLLRSIVKHADQNLGIYGNIGGSGILRQGDAVFLI